MRWRALRPVGEPLPPIRHDLDPAQVLPEGYVAYFVQSGTAALALALLVAKDRLGEKRKRVLLPAYGCPDLVSAVVYAGLEPELVDTAPNEPFLNLELLEARLDEGVAAVLAVHFLGLSERVTAVQGLARRVGAVVIEDSAQRLPSAGGAVADLVVLSFGRGKAVGALGGGALLVRQGSFTDVDVSTRIGPARNPVVPIALKRLLFNLAIRPVPYAIAIRLPGVGVGETRYRMLQEIRRLDRIRLELALTTVMNTSATLRSGVGSQLQDRLTANSEISGIWRGASDAVGPRLTRLPLLISSRLLRDRLHISLEESGLGSSVMYGDPLADLPGVPRLSQSSGQCARDFADRLLTLPVHSGVTDEHADRIEAIVTRYLAP